MAGKYFIDGSGTPYQGVRMLEEDREVTKEEFDTYLWTYWNPKGEAEGLEQFLASTDWYAIRAAETGVAIPTDVAEKRIAARARISEIRAALAEATA